MPKSTKYQSMKDDIFLTASQLETYEQLDQTPKEHSNVNNIKKSIDFGKLIERLKSRTGSYSSSRQVTAKHKVVTDRDLQKTFIETQKYKLDSQRYHSMNMSGDKISPSDRWQMQPKIQTYQKESLISRSTRKRIENQQKLTQNSVEDRDFILSRMEHMISEDYPTGYIENINKRVSGITSGNSTLTMPDVRQSQKSKVFHQKRVSNGGKEEIVLGRESSSKKLIKTLLDNSDYSKPQIGKKDPLDESFLKNIVQIKYKNGKVRQNKNFYEQEMVDKLILLERIENDLHQRLNEDLLPKPKKLTFLDSIKSSYKNGEVNGVKKLTRFKVYNEEF